MALSLDRAQTRSRKTPKKNSSDRQATSRLRPWKQKPLSRKIPVGELISSRIWEDFPLENSWFPENERWTLNLTKENILLIKEAVKEETGFQVKKWMLWLTRTRKVKLGSFQIELGGKYRIILPTRYFSKL